MTNFSKVSTSRVAVLVATAMLANEEYMFADATKSLFGVSKFLDQRAVKRVVNRRVRHEALAHPSEIIHNQAIAFSSHQAACASQLSDIRETSYSFLDGEDSHALILCTVTPKLINEAVDKVGDVSRVSMGAMPYNMKGSMFGDSYGRNDDDRVEYTHLELYARASKMIRQELVRFVPGWYPVFEDEHIPAVRFDKAKDDVVTAISRQAHTLLKDNTKLNLIPQLTDGELVETLAQAANLARELSQAAAMTKLKGKNLKILKIAKYYQKN